MKHIRLMQYGLALLLAGAPPMAAACDPEHELEREAATVGQRAHGHSAPAATRDPDQATGMGAGVAPAELARARGGAGGIASDTTLGGVVSGNSATNVITGSNTIAASSFAGMSGIPIVIQNSGANVLIQNATVINLQFK